MEHCSVHRLIQELEKIPNKNLPVMVDVAAFDEYGNEKTYDSNYDVAYLEYEAGALRIKCAKGE